jgi:long-chain acyl-CoA synthetase
MSTALLHAWDQTVRRRDDARAIVQASDGATVTFRELDARGTAWLARHAPEPAMLAGRAVVFSTLNGIGWFEIFLGLLRAGAIAVPLDAAEPVASQRQLGQSLRAGFHWDGSRLVPLAGAKRYRDHALCLIKLTSGTTGRPHALTFTASQLLADGRQVMISMGIRPRDLNYGLIPLGHSYGLGNLTVPLLTSGVSLVCGSAPLPQAIAADFARWRPTVFPGVPAIWRALAASDVALDSLRLGISAGAPLPPDVARDFLQRHGRHLHSFYGSSETGGIAYDPTGRAALNGGVGHAMHHVKLIALRGQRLRVSSPAVFTHGNRQRTGPLGAWTMADRIAFDSNRNLTLIGRRGTTVKIAGRRVNLAEVAARLRRVPDVRDVWVGVCEGGDAILGSVVASPRSAAEIRTALLTDTPPWKIPKKWAVVAALPVTARGKLDTRALQKMVF